MQFVIPATFEMGGLTIRVVEDATLFKTKKAVGSSRYDRQLIVLDPGITEKEMLEQLFFHELIHWILFMMGDDEKQKDEEWINLFSHFLYQSIKTMEQDWTVPRMLRDLTIQAKAETSFCPECASPLAHSEGLKALFRYIDSLKVEEKT